MKIFFAGAAGRSARSERRRGGRRMPPDRTKIPAKAE